MLLSPPSIAKTWAVIQSFSGNKKNTTPDAISEDLPILPRACIEVENFSEVSLLVIDLVKLVSIK